MKKNVHILSLLLIAFIAFGCSSDNESLDSTEQQQEEEALADLVIKEVHVQLIDSEDCSRRIQFNENGKLENVIWCEDATVVRTHFYNPDGQITAVTGYGDYIYDGARLIRRLGGNDTGSSTVDYIYEGNKVTSDGYYNGDPYKYNQVFEFENDTHRKLLNVTTNENVLNEPYVSNYVVYEYENNLLVRVTSEQFNEDTQQLELKGMTEYFYDDKRNPLQTGLNQDALIYYMTPLLYSSDLISTLTYQMQHNVIKAKLTNFEIGFEREFTYDYIYNENGFPISYEFKRDGESLSIFSFEYY